MPAIIATLSAPHDMEHLDFDGASSRPYRFRWNTSRGRYECLVNTQEDADDLMRTQSSPVGCIFPLTVIVDAEQPGSLKPLVEPKSYEAHTDEELRELATSAGIAVTERDKRNSLMRLLDAYFRGATYGRTTTAV